jgi:hypothetical protein
MYNVDLYFSKLEPHKFRTISSLTPAHAADHSRFVVRLLLVSGTEDLRAVASAQ